LSDRDKFAILRRAKRVWAVASIHGAVAQLEAAHSALAERFADDDRLVYLGNYLGHGPDILETLSEMLRFRRALIARPRHFAFDIAYLRGAQEEMWQKLLQLQFAPNPREVLPWLMEHGVQATLEAYGGSAEEGLKNARDGALSLTRWTSSLRAAMQAQPGHYALMTHLRQAAYSDDQKLLFVNAGLTLDRPLSAQTDALWWGGSGFTKMTQPYASFARVVRGFDRSRPGAALHSHSATIDGGAGFGGKLLVACFEPGASADPVNLHRDRETFKFVGP
jgi:serine/threonine protein phosphatase 1